MRLVEKILIAAFMLWIGIASAVTLKVFFVALFYGR